MLNPDFRDMLFAFTEEGVEFLVVGAYALAVHGIPRATGDLDFWVRRSPENARAVLRALRRFGAPTDTLTEEDLLESDSVLQIGVSPRRIDILTAIDGVSFDVAWQDRVVAAIDGMEVPVIGREALLANKRAVGRPRDLADVEELTRLSPDAE